MASKDGGRVGVMIMGMTRMIISKSLTAGTSAEIQAHWLGQLKRSLLPLRDHVGSTVVK